MYSGKTMSVKPIAIEALEIDLPISERNVQEKITSIKATGLIQPIAVWLGSEANGFKPRIIDGFHRVEAAKRLGWTEIMCNHIDCNEEGFWEARIDSAKMHHEIEQDRIVAWMCECWRASKWGNDDSNPLYSMPKTLWESGMMRSRPYGEELTLEQREILDWIKTHATRWGTDATKLYHQIIMAGGVVVSHNAQRIARDVAKQIGMDFESTRLLVSEIDTLQLEYYRDIQKEDIEECIKDYANKDKRLGALFTEHYEKWNETVGKEIRAKRRIEAEEEIKNADDRWQQHLRAVAEEELKKSREKTMPGTEQYRYAQAIRKRDIRKAIMDAYGKLFEVVGKNKDILKELPDGPDLLAEFAILAKDTIDELWPSNRRDVWEVPQVIRENNKLRRELGKEHSLRVAAEAQALEGRARAEKLREQLETVIAWPSS